MNGERQRQRRERRRTMALAAVFAGVARDRASEHDSRRARALELAEDHTTSSMGFLRRFKRRRRHAASRGGRRCKACSGELLPAVQGIRTQTSDMLGFLTSRRNSWCNSRRQGGDGRGNRRRRRPRIWSLAAARCSLGFRAKGVD
jgi:hypothetical protein